MDEDVFEETVIKYVMNRECKTGGFCFYRLEEPNGSDTYYAVSILHLLNVEYNDKSTIIFLKNIQKDDGSFDSIYSAYYSIKGLYLAGEKTRYNPEKYIKKNIEQYHPDNPFVDIASIFRPVFYLVELCHIKKIEIEEKTRNTLIDFVLSFNNRDNGFGKTYSTLIETFQALSILNWLEYPIDTLDTENFIKKCENQVYGFSNIPKTAPSFIEHIYAGLNTSFLLNYKPHYPDQCIRFIEGCRNNNGGFSRSPLGNSTLENTYYAVHSLILLQKS